MFKFKRQWEKRLWLEGDVRTFNKFALLPIRLTEKIERGDVRYVRKVWLQWVTVTQIFQPSVDGLWSTVSVMLKRKH